jgi:CTP-dependent riboflavin kinase
MLHKLVGEIITGQGLATGYLAHPVYARALGSLHPGTINVLVPDPQGGHRFIDQVIEPHRIVANGRLTFCPCTLNGQAAFILSTWPGESHRPHKVHRGHTMLEVVADRRLPGIAYGGKVTMEYDQAHLQTRKV